MAHYRRPEVDLSNRIQLAVEMLKPIPERPWGRATELASQYGISRTRLYELRTQAAQALTVALEPQPSGPQPSSNMVCVDKAWLQRAIIVLPMLTGSVRGIQCALELLVGVHRSVGYISATLQAAGVAASAYNNTLVAALPVLAEADEIFQGQHPALTVVDGRSFLVVNLSAAETRDGTTWGVTFLDLQARGFEFQNVASDGATGLQAGIQDAQVFPFRCFDLFHLLRDAHRLSGQLERAAYRAIAAAEQARYWEQRAQGPKRRGGRQPKHPLSRPEAEAKETQAIVLYDLWQWLVREVRQALEPMDRRGRLKSVASVRDDLEVAIELMLQLDDNKVRAQAHKLVKHLDDLLAPLVWLEQQLAPWRATMDAATEAFVVWAWQAREVLALEVEKDFPVTMQPMVKAVWEALSSFHRSSSLAESFHSWLRPHLQAHRGMPDWLLPLLQLFWNHHSFPRGKRAGQSPLQRAGVTNSLPLSEVLDHLLAHAPAGSTI
jgi:hypothetical protein